MASNLYCSRADVNGLVAPGEIESSSRLSQSANASSNIFTLSDHGLETDDPVQIRVVEGAGTLPEEFDEDETYYAIRLTNDKFQLSATAGGAAIDFEEDGVDVVIVREPNYDGAIEEWSRWCDTFLRPVTAVPLSTPLSDEFALVRRLVAKLAAYDLFNLNGKRSETFESIKLDAIKSFERIAQGAQLESDDGARRNLAVVSTASTQRSGMLP